MRELLQQLNPRDTEPGRAVTVTWCKWKLSSDSDSFSRFALLAVTQLDCMMQMVSNVNVLPPVIMSVYL